MENNYELAGEKSAAANGGPVGFLFAKAIVPLVREIKISPNRN